MIGNQNNKNSLSEDDNLYEILLKMVPDAIYIHYKGKFLFSNKAGLILLGAKTFDELEQFPVLHYVHPDYRDLVINRIKQLEIDKKDVSPSIEKLIRLDGSIITAEVEGRPIKFHNLEANLLVVRDLTQILSDQERLLESERRNTAILLALPDLVFIVNKEGEILDFNAPDEKLLYIPKQNVIGSNLQNILATNTSNFIFKRIKLTLRSKETSIFEYQSLNSKRDQTFEARFIYYGPNQIMVLVRDITKEKEIEKDNLRKIRIDSIGLLAGGIAHDFNNILTKILGNVNLISLEENNPVIFKYLKEIENATLQATRLTNQLLTFSKGGDPVTKQESIKEIIEESVSLFLSGSKSKVETFYSNESNDINVNAEAGQLAQVINNLVLNADQSMAEGGLIEITIDSVKLKSNQFPELKEGNYVKISIKDQGEGIPEDIKDKIFEPYFTTKKEGNGLGLTICYSIVKRHKGFIDVISKKGSGSTFTVYLPISKNKSSKKEKDTKTKQIFSGRALIMDDSVDIQKITGKMLEYLGFEFDVANDGYEAIEKYKNSLPNPYTLVIMDLTIPGGLGGKRTMEELLKIDSKVKAVVSSGYSNDPVLANYKKLGFKGILPKPYTLNDLKEVLSQFL